MLFFVKHWALQLQIVPFYRWNNPVQIFHLKKNYKGLFKTRYLWRSRAIEVSEKNNNQFYLTLNSFQRYISAGIYLLKLNYRNTRIKCETCSKLTLNTPEQHHWHRSGVFEHISHLVLVFLLLNLNKLLPARTFPKFETKSFNPLMPNVEKW